MPLSGMESWKILPLIDEFTKKAEEVVILLFDQIPLYANEAEENQHNNAIRMLCEELTEDEAVIRPIYEEILLEMKKQARIKEFLSILVCRTIRDLARGHEDSSYFRLDDSHVKLFKHSIQHAMKADSAVRE